MDIHNRFHTKTSFRWVRAEAVLALAAIAYLLLAFHPFVNWSRFLCALVAIDLLGYLPGAVAYRAARKRQLARTTAPAPIRIAPLYHHLYNLTHSFLSVGVVLALWWAWLGDVEWAMLALPLHLLGDRGLFGNTYKPTALPFEPDPSGAHEVQPQLAPAPTLKPALGHGQ